MMKPGSYLSLLFLLLAACHTTRSPEHPILSGDIRNAMNHLTTLPLYDEIEQVTYIPLEVTGDDDSVIDGVAAYTLTSEYIYVMPVQEPRVVLYDRQGRFIRTFIAHGQGPGELSDVVVRMQADEEKNRFYLFNMDRIAVYTLEGEYTEEMVHDYQVAFQAKTEPDRLGAIAFPFIPFESGSFGLGIFTENGEPVATKQDFHHASVPPGKTGFTMRMAAAWSGQEHSLLFKTGANDTVYRIGQDRIVPACVLRLKNSAKEISRSLDITDFSSLREPQREDGEIFIADLFETPRRYYFRLRHNLDHYVASVDKFSGKTAVEKCEQPGTLYEMAGVNLLQGMLGTRSYRNFPIWGTMENHELVQIVTPYELNFFRELPGLTLPEPLSSNEEEGNPIFIIYRLQS